MAFNSDTLAAHLRGKRAEAGLSQTEAAEAVGVHITTICRYESGESSPNAYAIWKLCELYGCDPADLLGWPGVTGE